MARLQNDERKDKCGFVLPCDYVNFKKYSTHWSAQCESLWRKKELLTPRNSKQACHLLLALLVFAILPFS
jgi:hypothetical protein